MAFQKLALSIGNHPISSWAIVCHIHPPPHLWLKYLHSLHSTCGWTHWNACTPLEPHPFTVLMILLMTSCGKDHPTVIGLKSNFSRKLWNKVQMCKYFTCSQMNHCANYPSTMATEDLLGDHFLWETQESVLVSHKIRQIFFGPFSTCVHTIIHKKFLLDKNFIEPSYNIIILEKELTQKIFCRHYRSLYSLCNLLHRA